jgi:NTP pyrophosphatase (non-canonical NTP hydrolase)
MEVYLMERKYVLKADGKIDIEKLKEEWKKADLGIITQPVMEFVPLNTINSLCKEAFETAKSKGWHEQPRSFGEFIALCHAELSEALEADRRKEGVERVAEELGDVLIRIFDGAIEFDLDIETAILTKMEYNKTRSYKHGNKAY